MVDVSSQNNSVSINVSTGGNSASINATPDMTQYYSEKSREWATSNRIVDNTDYSSKYYAEQSKVSANEAEVYERSVIEKYNSFIDISNQAETELQALRDDSVAQIKAEAQIGTSDIVNNKNNAISDINASKEAAQNSIDNLAKSYDNLTQRQITNCILEIPQRIKLELNNGTLTLKAGSILTVPNGFEANGTTPKFDYVTVENDVTWQPYMATDTFMVFYGVNGTPQLRPVASCVSGASDPNTKGTNYYNTATNLLITHNTAGDLNVSLPLGVVSVSSAVVTSINQVFNGMGYIGSTVWVDKGVKGLIPNGRNEDGTLNNIEVTTNNVLTRTVANDVSVPLTLFLNPTNTGLFVPPSSQVVYDEINNIIVNNATGERYYSPQLATFNTTKGVVSNFQPKQPFRVADYLDSSTVSGWGMPSDKYVDLTLGASGTAYTAPANGWLCFAKQASATNQRIALFNAGSQPDTMIGSCVFSSSNTQGLHVFVPAKKGDKITVFYNAAGANTYFRFIYAKGEQ